MPLIFFVIVGTVFRVGGVPSLE